MEPDDELVGLGPPPAVRAVAEARRLLEDQPELPLLHREFLPRPDEERDSGPAPVVDLEAHRRKGLRLRVLRDPLDLPVALVLPSHVLLRVGLRHRREDAEHRVLQRPGVAAGGRLHRGHRNHLHQVVDHHVPEGANGVVEAATVGDSEVLRHRDLDAVDAVAVPDGLEHRVRESQIENLGQAHHAEEVVDPVELVLTDVLMDLRGKLAGGGEVVAEGLLDHHPRVLGQTGLGEPLDRHPEEGGRDLQIEDRGPRSLDVGGEALVGVGLGEVALDVGEAFRQAVEDLRVGLLPGRGLDRLAGVLTKVLLRPVVEGDADDRAVEQAPGLEPVERVEGHHLGQIAGDAEADEDVGGALPVGGLPARRLPPLSGCCRQCGYRCSAEARSCSDPHHAASPALGEIEL